MINAPFRRAASDKLAMRQPHLKVVAEHMDALMARFEAEKPEDENKWLIRNNGFGILLHTKALQLFFLKHFSQPQTLPVPTERLPNTINNLHNFLEVSYPGAARHLVRSVSVHPLTDEELKNATPYMKDPNLQMVTRLFHQGIVRYAREVNSFIEDRHPHYAIKNLCAGLTSAIKTQGLWEELMPIIAHSLYETGRNAPLETGADLQQAFSKGFDAAISINAFTAQAKGDVRRCPFQSPLKHLLNTRIGRDENDLPAISDRGVSFIAFLYREQIAPYQAHAVALAQTPG